MIEKLKGKKTYLTAGLLVLLGVAQLLGYAEVPQEVVDGAKAVLGAAAVAFLRAGVDKAAEKTQ